MKILYRASDKLQLEVEGANQKEVFAELAKHQEIFSVSACGACRGTDLRYVVRDVVKGKKEYEYYEIHCQNHKCRAKLAFGAHQNGETLFPKRKDEDGKYLPNGGWTIWEGKKEE